MFGILLIDKPTGMTSHDVVNRVRSRFQTKRVGHSGTLDPQATGLLVLAIGPATRFLQYLPLEPKEYYGCIRFGATTRTYDAEAERENETEVPADLTPQIESELPALKGLIKQIPPMYSAVKVGGKPLYKLARAGEEIERKPRSVHIQRFDLLGVDGDRANVRIVCSGGTYVRTLAHDLGQAVGCGAYLESLRRTRSGEFNVDDAMQLDECTPEDLIPLHEALPPMPLVKLNQGQVHRVRHGQPVTSQSEVPATHAGLLDTNGHILGVARVSERWLHPECVLPESRS